MSNPYNTPKLFTGAPANAASRLVESGELAAELKRLESDGHKADDQAVYAGGTRFHAVTSVEGEGSRAVYRTRCGKTGINPDSPLRMREKGLMPCKRCY